MRHLGIVASSAPQASAPTITINSTTNFNQERATFNATVVPNGATTSVKFQYSTNGSTWTDSGTVSDLTGTSQSVYFNHSSPTLSANTLYYIRAVATNSAGSSTSSNTTFTTWRLIEWAMGTAGTYYQSIPTITPTGGSAVIPSIYNVFIIGGGGGSAGVGGAGGGYRLVSSRAFSSTANLQLTLIVGAGGANSAPPTAGGTTQITASNFTSIDAGGGGFNDSAYVGYGDNPAYQSGVSTSWSAGGKNDPIYFGNAGGAGINGPGGSGAAGNAYGYGGNGGAGGAAYGYNGCAGGRGFGTTISGSNGANHGYGSGGAGQGPFNGDAGTAGLLRFQYYGP